MATSAGLLGRAVKGNRVAPESDEMMSAMIGPAMQRQGLLDDAMVTYHGSPYKFDKFDMGKLGTGEGAQAYGHGLYFAENPKVAAGYRDTLTEIKLKDGTRMPTQEQHAYRTLLNHDGDLDDAITDSRQFSASLVSPDHVKDRSLKDLSILERWKNEGLPDVNEGALYKVDVPDESIAKMLDWDAPLSEQPESVRVFLEGVLESHDPKMGLLIEQITRGGLRRNTSLYGMAASPAEYSGEDLLAMLRNRETRLNKHLENGPAEAETSKVLLKAGIPGIKYYDGGSRAAGEGTRNFVVFDDKLPTILKRNDETIAQPSVDEFIGKLLDDGLPMDEASRMQRAQDMGFDTDAYHGTYSDIPEFSMDEKNRSHGIDRLGHWFDDSPETPSNLFASVMLEDPDAVAGPNIIPAKLRSKNPLVIASDTPTSPARAEYRAQQRKINNVNRRLRTLESGTPQHNAALTKRDQYEIARNKAEKEINGDSWDRLLEQIGDGERPSNEAVDAFRQRVAGEGYDSIVLQDTLADAASRDGTATTWRIMLDDKNIRSVNAAFDPAKRNSANLLATAAPIAATGLLGANALRGLYEPDALQDDEKMRRALLRN
jgi:hypothetical protein